MNYKTITVLLVVTIFTAIFIFTGQRLNKTAEKSDSPYTIETEKPAASADSFIFLVACENTSETDEDVLIAVLKAEFAPPLAEGKWINSEPLTLEKLQGKVLLVDFWTFGCYNCVSTLPTLKSLDTKYRDKGLTIIGVETPETNNEKIFDNLVRAVDKRGIKYPDIEDKIIPKRQDENLHIAGFRTNHNAVFVVSDLSDTENLVIAQTISVNVRRRIEKFAV